MQETEIDIKAVFALLRRQMRLILLTVFLLTGVTLVYLFMVTPLYTATALVMVDPSQRNILDAGDPQSANRLVDNAWVESEVEVLRANSTAIAVISREALSADPEFGPSLTLRRKILRAIGFGSNEEPQGDVLLQRVLAKFKSALVVRRRGATYLISVSVTSESPERAARLANATAEIYIERQVAAKVGSSLAGRDILASQVNAAREALADSEDALDAYITENIARLEEESGSDKIAALRRSLEAARDNQLATEVSSQQASAALERQDWATLSNTLGDQALSELARQQDVLSRRLGEVAQDSTEFTQLREQLSKVESGMEERASAAIGSLQSNLSGLNAEAQDYTNEIRAELLSGELSSQTLAELYELQQEASITRNQYQTLLSRMRELETQSTLQLADSRIVSEALPPANASFPRKKLSLGLALMASLGLGLGLAILNEYYVGGITSPLQLANIVPARVGTSVPFVEPTSGQTSLADNVISAPLSNYSEAVRRLRASIDQALRARDKDRSIFNDGAGAERGKVILVTSSIPAEGKTTTALALARTYAAAGKKTLLIDADLRKPTLHRQLGLKPESGFLNFLQDPSGTGEAAQFYGRDPLSSVEVILGANRSDVPTDQLLNSATFENLIAEARESMDVTIIDSPPLVPVVDAQYIAAQADAIVLAIRYAVTGQSELRQAYSDISDAMPADTVLLTVLNHEEGKKSSYRYQGYYADYNVEDA